MFGKKAALLKNFIFRGNKQIKSSPQEGYRVWAEHYDEEENNLMLYYDNILFRKLISGVEIAGKMILDFGCGTGRNWPTLRAQLPAKLIGCDISPEMLAKLHNKFTDAETYCIGDNKLPFIQNNKCDLIVSTLVIGHIRELYPLIEEWSRVLKERSDIILTDFHPALLSLGGTRTFKNEGKKYVIENHIHSVNSIESALAACGFKQITLLQKSIEDDVKEFYIKKNALHVYEKFKGVPFIFGMHVRR